MEDRNTTPGTDAVLRRETKSEPDFDWCRRA